MKRLELRNGGHALVDDVHYERVAHLPWTRVDKGTTSYAKYVTGGVYLHQMILVTTKQVDHINGNGLDCQQGNLREATAGENRRNRGKQRNNQSGFKGVTAHQGRWRANIRHEGKQRHLGVFGSPEAAHEAYVAAAKRLHGEFWHP